MIWQDIVITAASITFSLSLIPQVYHGYKQRVGPIQLQTSIPTFIGLYAIAIAMWTLSLFFSAIVTFITGTLWFLLFLQGLLYKSPPKK